MPLRPVTSSAPPPSLGARVALSRGSAYRRVSRGTSGFRRRNAWNRWAATWRCGERSGITVHGRPLHGIDVDMNDISDTVMTLAAVACFAEGPTTIRNVAHIRHKETDRLAALATELRRLGATVEERADGLTIVPAAACMEAVIRNVQRSSHGHEASLSSDSRCRASSSRIRGASPRPIHTSSATWRRCVRPPPRPSRRPRHEPILSPLVVFSVSSVVNPLPRSIPSRRNPAELNVVIHVEHGNKLLTEVFQERVRARAATGCKRHSGSWPVSR